MSNCIILTDAVVKEILLNTTKSDLLLILDKVISALKDFSTSNERKHQPAASVISRPDGHEDIFRLFTSTTGVGAKIIVHPIKTTVSHQQQQTYATETDRIQKTSLHGVLALCDENGYGKGFINAEELTAYRTSLCAMWIFLRRKHVKNIVVFGAGKCALWHVRLIFSLRGHEIESLTLINRSRERTELLLEQIKKENEVRWRVNATMECIVTSDGGDEDHLEKVLDRADCIFCTTASKDILVPASIIRGREAKGTQGRYISAIGSWRADMIEVDPEILKVATADREKGKGLVIVDSLDECFHATGEITRSGLAKDQLLELGEVVDLESQLDGDDLKSHIQCLESGLVVYKSVGVSMTDLAIGQALLDVARQRRLGVSIPDF